MSIHASLPPIYSPAASMTTAEVINGGGDDDNVVALLLSSARLSLLLARAGFPPEFLLFAFPSFLLSFKIPEVFNESWKISKNFLITPNDF